MTNRVEVGAEGGTERVCVGAMVAVGRVVWPAFLAALVAEVLLPAADPSWFGEGEWGSLASRSLQFVGYWAIGILSSCMTRCLLRTPDEVNRAAQLVAVRPGA